MRKRASTNTRTNTQNKPARTDAHLHARTHARKQPTTNAHTRIDAPAHCQSSEQLVAQGLGLGNGAQAALRHLA